MRKIKLITSGAVESEINREVIKHAKSGEKKRWQSEGGADATGECDVGTAYQRIWQAITLAIAIKQELNTEHINYKMWKIFLKIH